MRRAYEGDLLTSVIARKKLERIARVVLIGSGKGGVGKSTIATSLALLLSREGQKTALFDIDIHGSSIPEYVGVTPPLRSNRNGLEPRTKGSLKIMSVGLFTGSIPIPMRGGNKQELITQLFALTEWGNLDCLIVDLPPSMGDELLAAFRLFSGKACLVLVTTPSPGAVSVVSRLRQLAETEKIPVKGIIVNMAYMFNGNRKSYPFGKSDRKLLNSKFVSAIIGEVPLEPLVSTKDLNAALSDSPDFSRAIHELVRCVCN